MSAAQGGAVATLVSGVFSVVGLQTDIPSILIFIVAVMILKAALTMLAVVQVAWSSAHVTANLRKALLDTSGEEKRGNPTPPPQ